MKASLYVSYERLDITSYSRKDINHNLYISYYDKYENYNRFLESLEIKPNTTYIVIFVLYTDGDSYGCHSGNIRFIDCVDSLDKARKVIEKIETKKYSGYSPWNNSFGALESIGTWTFTTPKEK